MASREAILAILALHPHSTTVELVEHMGFVRGTPGFRREYEIVRKRLPQMLAWKDVILEDDGVRSTPYTWIVREDPPG